MGNGEGLPITAGISRKTYEGLPVEDKLNVLLDFSIAHEECLREIKKTLSNRKKIDIKVSAGTGFGAGFSAMLLKWLFFH